MVKHTKQTIKKNHNNKKTPAKKQRGGSDGSDYDWDLIHAVMRNNLDEVLEALNNGADASAINMVTGQSALIYAADNGNVHIVNLLLENGADVNDDDNGGNTPLMIASERGHPETVKLLIESGASMNAQDKYKRTALMKASESGRLEVVTTLLKKGADVNAKDKWNKTAIFHAIDQGHENVVPILLENNIDLTVKNKKNLTALEYAKDEEYDDMVKLIEDHIKEKKQEALLKARLVTEKGTTKKEDKPLLTRAQPEIARQIAKFAGGKRKTRKSRKSQSKRGKTSKKK